MTEGETELGETLRRLEQDHALIAQLVGDLQAASEQARAPGELRGHIEGIAAVLESHFRSEERQLLAVLDGLTLDADPGDVLGPL